MYIHTHVCACHIKTVKAFRLFRVQLIYMNLPGFHRFHKQKTSEFAKRVAPPQCHPRPPLQRTAAKRRSRLQILWPLEYLHQYLPGTRFGQPKQGFIPNSFKRCQMPWTHGNQGLNLKLKAERIVNRSE